jgi:hypothetical protein
MTNVDPFPIVRVNLEDADDVETLGTKPKFWWFNHQRTRLLFKAEDRGTGEDWAEKIACHLCDLLGLPHVHYDLACEYEQGEPRRPGVICENLTPAPLSLLLGNQLLFERDDSYPLDEQAKYKVRLHTVDAIISVLNELDPPRGWIAADDILSALDIFVGYVMLDCWIANQDRHHGNWGAVRNEDGRLSLSPTFDHGAALARLLTDEERQERLTSRDRYRSISVYVTKARSACYADAKSDKTLGTLECFRAFSSHATAASKAWTRRLEAIQHQDVWEIIQRVPSNRISKIGRQFTMDLLNENKKRILQMDIR